INDLELWAREADEVLGIAQIAKALELRERYNTEMVSEVLVNDGTQKGGLLLWRPGMAEEESYLLEGLSAETPAWAQEIKRINADVAKETAQARKGSWYNRFNQTIWVNAIAKTQEIDRNKLGVYPRLRLRYGGYQYETPFGDYSYVLKHQGIYREGAKVRDFKAFKDLVKALEAAGEQDSASSSLESAEKILGSLVNTRMSSSAVDARGYSRMILPEDIAGVIGRRQKGKDLFKLQSEFFRLEAIGKAGRDSYEKSRFESLESQIKNILKFQKQSCKNQPRHKFNYWILN
ncbi:MAG: hypothetical protein UR86_C0022G0001, partial [Parcubacteria group bacterium GW2011_GWD2_35_7]